MGLKIHSTPISYGRAWFENTHVQYIRAIYPIILLLQPLRKRAHTLFTKHFRPADDVWQHFINSLLGVGIKLFLKHLHIFFQGDCHKKC